MKKKITFVIGYMSNGGAERVISVLANFLVKKGHDITILTILGDKVDYDLDVNIKYLPLVSKHKSKVYRILERIIFIRKHTKSEDCDVIISFLAQINIYSIIAHFFRKNTLVISERNDPNQDPNSKLVRFIRDILYNFADKYVFQTEDCKLYFNPRIQKKSTIIFNPLKDNLPLPFSGDRRKVIVTAARLEPQKNLKMLIDTFYYVHNKYPEYKLEIYGEGEQKKDLINYCIYLGIENSVLFKGYCTNLHEQIIDAAIFMLSSNYEGISNSLIESLALGIPTISTDHPIGGAKMFIKNGFNGFLVPINDSEMASKKIFEIIENKDIETKITQNAVIIRQTLNVEKITNEWEKYILRED